MKGFFKKLLNVLDKSLSFVIGWFLGLVLGSLLYITMTFLGLIVFLVNGHKGLLELYKGLGNEKRK